MKKQRHREVRTLIQNHTACRSWSLPLLSPGQCLGWPQWSLKAVPALSCVKAILGASYRLWGREVVVQPFPHLPTQVSASSGVLGLAAAPRLCAPSTGLSSLPWNCNVGGRSGKHIVCRRKTEWFFLFLKVVMVQLVAKPLPSLPSLASPSFPSTSLPFLSWEEVAALESQSHHSHPCLPGRGPEFGGRGTQCLQVPLDLGQLVRDLLALGIPNEQITVLKKGGEAIWRFRGGGLETQKVWIQLFDLCSTWADAGMSHQPSGL